MDMETVSPIMTAEQTRLLALGRKAKADQDEQWQETIARSTQQVPPAFQRGANKEQN